MILFTAKNSYEAKKNTVAGEIIFSDYAPASKIDSKTAVINTGGWQSWNPGFEIMSGKKQPNLGSVIKGWNRYLVFPESLFKASKNIVLSQFVCYLRNDDFYLVLVSCGSFEENILPPVQFVIDRKRGSAKIELADKGKSWKEGDVQAKIEVFTAESFFECKKKLSSLFGDSHFKKISALGKNPAGWESWYNHYSKIDEKLIQKDLESLSATKNIISTGDWTSKIFQIDDGWEKGLGNWEIDEKRFPAGLAPLAAKIEDAGYIPGLWIAPFIIDLRSPVATEHPDWLLRDEKGHLIPSGYNPLWGSNGIFYCLDLSLDDVLDFVDGVILRAVNEWGFRYLKLDFLYAGMFYGNFKNKGSAYEWYERAVSRLTSHSKTPDGKDVFFLGCGAPFEMSYKHFPLCRIGCDTLEHWENKLLKLINWNGRNSAYLNIKDTLGHAMWNRIIFANDPDVLFIRDENCSLTKNQKMVIAAVASIFGSQIMYSDDPSASNSENEIKLTEEILDFMKKFKNEDFAVQIISEDVYKIFTESKSYSGTIRLDGENAKITLNDGGN